MTTKLLVAASLAVALTGCSKDQPRASHPADPPSPSDPAPTADVISGADPALPAPAASRPAPDSAEAIVVARLVKRQYEGGAPHCGVLYIIDVMDYDVVRVEHGAVHKRRIRVAQGCPEMLQTVDVGSLHRLTLDQNYPYGESIPGADYWAARTVPAS